MLAFSGSTRYELRKRIGAGGMGVVYEAYDRERDLVVALKTLELDATPSQVSRLKREFRALANVVHPNLVPLYELYADTREVFFTMELIRGKHLDEWLAAAGAEAADGGEAETERLSPATGDRRASARARFRDDASAHPTLETVDAAPPAAHELDEIPAQSIRAVFQQLANGVLALHSRGLLHRDLKPSNIKVRADARVVVLDFGLVRDIAEESRSADDQRPLEGTVAFMSPEQAARMPLGPASDWYSVGVMLFSSLTGRLPFLGGQDLVLLEKQRFEAQPPHELNPHAPRDLSELCSELLRRDPDRRPGGLEILRRLGSAIADDHIGATFTASPRSTSGAAIGRERELAALDDALCLSRRGAPVLVRVAGRSGMGKSHLLSAFLSRRAEQSVILRSRCYESEQVPFKAFDGLIDELAQALLRMSPLEVEGLMPRDALALARLFPTLRQVDAFTAQRRRPLLTRDPHELRRRAFGALAELLARLADRGPVILSIDDLQWGDVDSAQLLAAVLRAQPPAAMLLLAAFRSEDRELSPCLAALREQTADLQLDEVEVAVGPLEADDARALALEHLRGTADADRCAARIVHEAQGVPYFVEELARHTRQRGGSLEGVSLGDVLRQRLSRLPDEARRLLSVIAVAGRPISRQLASRTADVHDPAMLQLLQAACLARSRSIGGERYVEPYHDSVREAAVGLLEAKVLRARHLALARAFESQPRPDAEALAMHYAAAGVSERAASFAAAAARRASEALAFDRAAALYRMAIDHHLAPPRELLIGLGDALAHAGRGGEAADAYLAAIPGGSAADALELRIRASRHLLASGQLDRGLLELEQVLGDVDLRLADSPGRALASIAWSRLRLAIRGLSFREQEEQEIPASQLRKVDVAFYACEGLGMADVIRAADFQGRHALLALKVGEPRRVARALAGEAIFSSFVGLTRQRRTREALDGARAVMERVGEPETEAIVRGAEGLVAFNEGRFRDSLAALRASAALARERCVGMQWELATAQLFAGCALGLLGELAALTREYPQLLEDARERGDIYTSTSALSYLGSYPPLVRGDPEGARAAVESAIDEWSARGFHLQHINALHSLARIDLYEGAPGQAIERYDRAWPAIRRSLLLRGQFMRVSMFSTQAKAIVSYCLLERATPALLARARRLMARIQREDTGYARANLAQLEAELALAEGNQLEAVEQLARAERLSELADMKLSLHAARRARGIVLGGDEGARLVADADAYFRGEGVVEPARAAAVYGPSLFD